ESHLVQAANRVENRPDAAPEFVIVAIVETLQVDFVQVDPWAQIVEDLRRPIAIRDKCRYYSSFAGSLKYLHRPLAGDQRLVVGANQRLRTLAQCVLYQKIGRCFKRRSYRVWISQGLRSNPVLTVRAMQIAPEHSKAVGHGAGIGMEERLFLD